LEITDVKISPSFTSRGDETVEATVFIKNYKATATAPAGASTGETEVIHLPKGGFSTVEKNFDKKKLLGVDAADLKAVYEALVKIGGSDRFEKIGGATAFAVSVAALAAESLASGKPFYSFIGFEPRIPYPLGNVLGGGKHAGTGSPDIQEFLSSPVGAKNAFEAVTLNIKVHKEVKKEIEKRDPMFAGGKGDEGAWAPRLKDEEALDIVRTAIDRISKEYGVRIIMGLDMAASTLYENGFYNYARKGKKLSKEDQFKYVEDIIRKYDLKYVEDPFFEEDFESFAQLTKSSKALIVGDDLFTTDYKRLEKGVKMGAANAVILKVNQVGTLYQAKLFAEVAHKNNYAVITSHRSGDVCEGYLADIAVGMKSSLIKSGVVGGERMSKLIRLARINEENEGIPLWRPSI
jgi:enolase